MKARRQQAILDLVTRERCGSQEDIRLRLGAIGLRATQSTISRDIEELGLVRIHDAEGLRYAVRGGDEPNGSDRTRLRGLLREFAVTMTPSANILVITTPPGAANALAEGIDRVSLDELAGTVAGDNTIMLVTREGVEARELRTTLRKIMKESPR